MSVNVTLAGQLLYPSEYVGAADLKGRDVTLTISSVEVADLQMHGGKVQKKPVVHFVRTDKKLVMNKTNAGTIAGLYGGEVTTWAGKKITLYPAKCRCGGSTVDCVRVRDAVPGAHVAPPSDGLDGEISESEADRIRDSEAAQSNGRQ